ncbi:hypothetical protein OA78_0409 [Latilactobacillus curvatus]|nr:hypothetical protein OA78_0409 [Latilactobacillus curvatus]
MRHQRVASEHLPNLANWRCKRRFAKCSKAQEAVDESTFKKGALTDKSVLLFALVCFYDGFN